MNKFFTGIDIGSRTTKAVCLDDEGSIIYTSVNDTGLHPGKLIGSELEVIKKEIGFNNNDQLVIYTTGYGRYLSGTAMKSVTEITCHARGVNYFFPESRTIIDIGGQDSKGIAVNSSGRVLDFVMNDKCAAGTGRFLEVVSTRLGIDIDDLSELADKSCSEIKMNSTCVVFAESEIVGLLADNSDPQSIAAAVINSIAERTMNLISRLDWLPEIIFTGGVARNEYLRKKLTGFLKKDIKVPANPFITGAVGAALIALEENN